MISSTDAAGWCIGSVGMPLDEGLAARSLDG